MPDSSTSLHDLELRYDGPIPAYHRNTENRARRRDHGTIAALEMQALAFLDAALRCETEIQDLIEELADLLCRPRKDLRDRLVASRSRMDIHIACAADALKRAANLRAMRQVQPHPLVRVVDLMRG